MITAINILAHFLNYTFFVFIWQYSLFAGMLTSDPETRLFKTRSTPRLTWCLGQDSGTMGLDHGSRAVAKLQPTDLFPKATAGDVSTSPGKTAHRGSELLTLHCRKLGLPQGVMAGERVRDGETEEGGRPRQLQSFTTSSWEWRTITCILLPIRLALYSVETTPQGVNDSPLSWEAGSIGIILDTLHHTTLLSQAFNHLVNYFLQHYFNELIILINFIKLLHSNI